MMYWEAGRRTLHNEELHNMYSSPPLNWDDEIKEDEIKRACSTNLGAVHTKIW
jgi:hypothetical protein